MQQSKVSAPMIQRPVDYGDVARQPQLTITTTRAGVHLPECNAVGNRLKKQMGVI